MDSNTAFQQVTQDISSQYVNLAAPAAAPKQSFLAQILSFNFSGLGLGKTLGLVLALLAVLIIFIIIIRIWRYRVKTVLVATYMALALVYSLPYLKTAEDFLAGFFSFGRAIIFGIIFLILFIIISKSSLGESLTDYFLGFFESAILAGLAAGLLFSSVLSLLPKETQGSFSFLIQILFISEIGRLCWLLLPIFGLTLGRRRRRYL